MSTPRPGDQPLQVLIIDGDNVRRGMLACTLPSDRFSLEFARSAEKGLDLLGHLQPDVVIVGHDGAALELCQRLRSLPAGLDCTLVVMDERFRDERSGEAAAEAAGADTFLPFPFEAAQFEERLRLRGRRRSHAGAAVVGAPPSTPIPIAFHAPPPAATTTTPGGSNGWDEFRTRVHWFHDHLAVMDYYQVLQVEPDATAAGIKGAYFRCSMEFHPDRFLQLGDEELRTTIYEVYKRMSEAFKVLFNGEARAQYDAALHGEERQQHLRCVDRIGHVVTPEDPTSDAATPAAKRYLHFANVAEGEGNLRSTRMYLTLALQCEPHNTALRQRLDIVTRRLEP